MAKATIEIEMPESCWGCPFRFFSWENNIAGCRIMHKDIDNGYLHESKPSWCPLKEVVE